MLEIKKNKKKSACPPLSSSLVKNSGALSWRRPSGFYSSGMDATGRVGTTSPACAVEDILCQDDILSHVFASSCWLDPCWCFPYREPPPNQRPTPAIHLCLLLRLRLICHQWRAVIDEVAARPHTALDHSGCRRLAQWIERSMACVHMRMTL